MGGGDKLESWNFHGSLVSYLTSNDSWVFDTVTMGGFCV